jgi:hypothetical protein
MATVAIAGNSYVITSAITMTDLETVKKYRPSAMGLTNPETKETFFRVGIGTNSVNEYGVSFGGVSNDEIKLATATLTIPSNVKDAKEYVLDKAGTALSHLNKVEAVITEAIDEILLEREAISENIKVIV